MSSPLFALPGDDRPGDIIVLQRAAESDRHQQILIRPTSGRYLSFDSDLNPQMSNPGSVGDGTVAAPSYSFSADSDTGFYRSATNAISVASGGVHAMRFEADGSSEGRIVFGAWTYAPYITGAHSDNNNTGVALWGGVAGVATKLFSVETSAGVVTGSIAGSLVPTVSGRVLGSLSGTTWDRVVSGKLNVTYINSPDDAQTVMTFANGSSSVTVAGGVTAGSATITGGGSVLITDGSSHGVRLYPTSTNGQLKITDQNVSTGVILDFSAADTLYLKNQAGSADAALKVGIITACAATATPANGSTSARLLFGTTSGFGIYYGSGAPSVSAAQGSIYLRSDGSSTSTRLYVNTTGSTTWTNLTSAT